MGEVVTPIVGILTSNLKLLEEVLGYLANNFGAADIIGEWQRFDHTTYYENEMGEGLLRTFVSFEKLMPSHLAANFKAWTSSLENKYRQGEKRTVNIDAGFIDANKVVLMSGKGGGHKIAVAPGVWADMLLWYNKGWVPFPWAFPDFRDGRLFPLFLKMRRRFKELKTQSME